MGLAKHKMMEEQELDNPFEGSEGGIAFLGGFLDVRIDGKTICTVSIPIPDLMADRHRDSRVDWDEYFEDSDGNYYMASVYSSLYGVDWNIDIIEVNKNSSKSLDDIRKDIASRINITVHYTESG